VRCSAGCAAARRSNDDAFPAGTVHGAGRHPEGDATACGGLPTRQEVVVDIGVIALGLAQVGMGITGIAIVARAMRRGTPSKALDKVVWCSGAFAGCMLLTSILTAKSRDERRLELQRAAQQNTALWAKSPVVINGVRMVSAKLHNDTLVTRAIIEGADPAVADIAAIKSTLRANRLAPCAQPDLVRLHRMRFSAEYVFLDVNGLLITSIRLDPGDCK
jgi:hypothetical protein